MLAAASRLRRSQDFTSTVRSGRRAGTRSLVIHLLVGTTDVATADETTGPDAPPETSRAGFVVSGKIGNSVVRHRITRRLRPLVRDRLPLLPAGSDLVIRALAPAATADSATLAADLDAGLRSAARKAGISMPPGVAVSGVPVSRTPVSRMSVPS